MRQHGTEFTLNAIETEGLTKIYRRGSVAALEDLSLQVPRGELFGFLGPNGAGKTTTIRILMTLLRPTRGRARVAGHDLASEPLEAMRRVGFMPENPGFYAGLSGLQHLKYYASLYGLDRSNLDGRINELLRRVGLEEAAGRKAKAYSLGMKRRLALAGALLPEPELMILDEPSLGLDPQGMAFVRNLLKDLHAEGRTIFLSSHLLDEVQKICTRVAILRRGRLLRVDTPRALTQVLDRGGTTLEVETHGAGPDVLELLRAIPGVARVELQGATLQVSGDLSDDAIAEVNRRLITSGAAILSSRRLEPNLEAAFLALMEDKR